MFLAFGFMVGSSTMHHSCTVWVRIRPVYWKMIVYVSLSLRTGASSALLSCVGSPVLGRGYAELAPSN